MCGYIRRHVGPKTLREFLELLGLTGYIEEIDEAESDEPVMQHFYPAFGGDVRKTIKGLIICEEGKLRWVDATWWYDCYETSEGEFKIGERKTFNARNLTSPFWRAAVKYRRGIVVCTGLGEGKTVDGKDRHYLVEANRLMFLGALYQSFPSGNYSCAVITRDEHPRFSEFHDKAFPLFLPNNLEFLRLWLSDATAEHPQIAQVLAHPRIYSELTVTAVKTFKGGVATGTPQLVQADG